MSVIVSRTCTEVSDTDHNRKNESRPLDNSRSKSAYVLLGDPGSGKTTAFQAESEVVDDACYIPARDFLTLNVDRRPEWREKTLFIDGLDEVRAGTVDVRTSFDAIRGRLDALGKPRFRLSCREADWLGANDRDHLASVSLDGTVTVLRLDPLTNDDIIAILDTQPGVNDAQEFVAKARERGVDGLLTNPQSLELLAKAVTNEGWPENRLDTFERACRQMVREPNDEHRAARREAETPSLDQLLDAAGRLCAVQLIAGIAGYTVGLGESDSAYPSPEECGGDIERGVYKAALATKLFKVESETRFIPVHRHIAEFLGARHLAQLIDGGLSIQRVLALITGGDGGVVTEMRGLSAWLAAQCPRSRMTLIERDPIGVGLYGDLHQFLDDEKRVLLNALEHTGGRLGSELSSQYWTAAFGPLATPDMKPVLEKILTDPARDEQHQILTLFVLRILEEGPPLPKLSDPLFDMARDHTRAPRINGLALHAFLHTCPDGQDKTDRLKGLLADIQTGRVADPEDELIGTLLTQLYPQHLPAPEVWNYLSESKSSNLTGGAFQFWSRVLLEQSSDEDVAELLDRLLCPPPGLRSALETARPYLENLVLKLLARGLQAYGEKIPPKRLYDWLDVGCRYSDHKASRDVRAWLEHHQEIQKVIVIEGFQRAAQSPSGNPNGDISWVNRHLYGANPPPDFVSWCGEQAKKAPNLRLAEYFIRRAERAGLSLEAQWGQERDHPELQRLISKIIAQSKAEERASRREEQSYTKERKRQEEKWFAYVRSNEAALRENRAAPVLLHQLAITWLDSSPFSHENGCGALREKLGHDQALIDAALRGLRGVVDRGDVPDGKKILDLYQENYQHYLSLPFLVSLVEIEEATLVDLSRWDDSRLRTALAFYFCTPFPGDKPWWYRRLLKTRPELVAEVQVQYARVALHSGQEIVNDLRELAYDREHIYVAQHASLPLLQAFPARCKLNQLIHLDNLLWAALEHGDRPSLGNLIERKLSRPSMNTMQQVHWLAAGLVVAPTLYRDRLSDFVQDRTRRIEHVTAFFYDRPSRYQLEVPVELGVPEVKFLIRLIGSHSEPSPQLEEGPITSLMKGSQLVHAFVHRLATSPAQEATDALATLSSAPALIPWQDVLKQARDSQWIIRRDTEYRHPDVRQVCETLQNGPPANAADLAALVMDQLRDIADQIHTSDSNDWRQYWNEDSYGRPQNPKPENSCRDALLSSLRAQLPPGVQVQPEAKSAADTRVDIRVSWAGFNVPVEIKKSCHRDVWSAMRNQLIAQYMQGSDASGYGIYLVFWFGPEKCKPGVDGRPRNADELERRLECTLSPDEACKVSVCVIDVTKPFDSASDRSG